MDIYVVTEFGCNSSHNDMYPPKILVFKNREDAYAHYTNEKNKILQMKEDYGIDFMLYCKGECIIQCGMDDEHGAKRPIGVMIKHQFVQ
jgi:hypothetical protein